MKLPDGIIQPVPFIEGLCTLEGGSRIKLFPHQKVIKPALIESPAAECIYSSIKRSAKSTIGAALTVWGSTQLGPPHMPPGDFLIASRTHLAAQSGVGRMVWGMFEREPALMDLVDTMNWLDIASAQLDAESGQGARVLLGFSQGSIIAARWAVARERIWDAVIIWGGAIPRGVDPHALAARSKTGRIELVVGERDAYATPERRAMMRAALKAAGVPVKLRTFPGGHRLDNDMLAAVAAEFE